MICPGRTDLTLYLKSGDINKFCVDSVFGWTYSGNYLLVHTPDGDTIPYHIGDIFHFSREIAETIH